MSNSLEFRLIILGKVKCITYFISEIKEKQTNDWLLKNEIKRISIGLGIGLQYNVHVLLMKHIF